MEVKRPPFSISKILKGKEFYNILILPDLHIPLDMDLKEIVLHSEILKDIDYAILLGDNVACYGDVREYEFLNAFIEKLGLPYTAVNGNHEFMFRVQRYGTPTYGNVWVMNDKEEKIKQLEKFYNFFLMRKNFWSETIGSILYLFFCIGAPGKEKIEVLPEGGENFLQETLKDISPLIDKILIFCHSPVFGSGHPQFKYYTEDGDPFLHLKQETLNLIEKLNKPVYWVSGHIHLQIEHPMALIRKINKNFYQINCPPSWRWSRKDFQDIVPKRYDGFSSVMLQYKDKKLFLKVYDWLNKKFIKELSI